MQDYNYCRTKLEVVSDLVDGLAEVKAYDEPAKKMYQIFATFKYPVGAIVEVDSHYNGVRDRLGPDWRVKLTVEQSGNNDLTVARISALYRYDHAVQA